jgi:hypothetical protein
MVMRLPAPTVCTLQLVDYIVRERQNGRNAGFFTGIPNSSSTLFSLPIADPQPVQPSA